MVASPEPPTKRVRLRSRALTYIRRFRRLRRFSHSEAGNRRNSPRSDTGRSRPPFQSADRRSFVDSRASHPLIHDDTRNDFTDSTIANTGIKSIARRRSISSSAAADDSISSKRSNGARISPRQGRGNRNKHQSRLHASLYGRDGCRVRLFCCCCVDKDAFDPGETSSFRWGVGFDDSDNSKLNRLSSGTTFRLGLCGFQASSELRGGESFIGDSCARLYNEFDPVCASPAPCPLPLELASTRIIETPLQLNSRNETNSRKFTVSNESIAIAQSSNGFKQKTPPSSSHSSYTSSSPPSSSMSDFRPMDTFTASRPRSRVSVGCNGWFLADDDPSITDWYRHRSASSGGVDVKAGVDEDLASSLTSCRPSSPSPPKSSPARSPDSPVSALLLACDRSVSSPHGGGLRGASRALMQTPFAAVHYRSSLPSMPLTSRFTAPEEIGNETAEYDPPTKRRRSISSSSNSSGGFGFGNIALPSMADSNVRLTKSLSPRTRRRAWSQGKRDQRSRSHSGMTNQGQSRRLFRFSFKRHIAKSASIPRASDGLTPRPSIVFIDCTP